MKNMKKTEFCKRKRSKVGLMLQKMKFSDIM